MNYFTCIFTRYKFDIKGGYVPYGMDKRSANLKPADFPSLLVKR